MDTSSMTKKELKEYKNQLKREEAIRRIKSDEKTSFWMRLRYKYCTMHFAKQLLWALFRFVLLVGISYVIVFPYISKIASSVMNRDDFTNTAVHLISMDPTLDTYKAIITENRYFEALFNTTLLSVLCAVSQTLICSIVGYGFAKFKFKFKNFLFICVIFTMIVPHETIQLSMFMKFKAFDFLGIYDSIANLFANLKTMITFDGGFSAGYDALEQAFYAAGHEDVGVMDVLFSNPKEVLSPNLLNSFWPFAVLSLTALAFKNGLFIYIMRQYFNGVPDELEEAAYVDGAGVMKTFVRIILPMAVPMMVTIFMFSFSWQWSDTFYTSLFFTNTRKTILLPNIVSKIPTSLDTDYAGELAYKSAIRNTCGLLILAPLVIIYLFAQRTLIEGVERSGITG